MKSATASTSRRAFATFTALALVTLVGASLAALAVLFAGDLKRSVRQSDDAQLRQLLLAGEVAVRGALTRGEVSNAAVQLPADLGANDGSLSYEKIDAKDANEIRVVVTARVSKGRSTSQTLTYARAGDRWELRSVEL